MRTTKSAEVFITSFLSAVVTDSGSAVPISYTDFLGDVAVVIGTRAHGCTSFSRPGRELTLRKVDQTHQGAGFGSAHDPTYPLATYGSASFKTYDLASNFATTGFAPFCLDVQPEPATTLLLGLGLGTLGITRGRATRRPTRNITGGFG